jgi:glycerol-3-phosphate dehydrogenase subunit C
MSVTPARVQRRLPTRDAAGEGDPREGVTRQDRFLGDPDRTARRSTGAAAALVNWANGQPRLRKVVESTVGIHRDRVLPPFARETFERWFRRRAPVRAERAVVLFETCSVDYNYPHVGAAAVQVLEHNGIRVERPPERCCGMPALDGGDIDAATATARANVETLLPFVDKLIVVLGPTCGYTISRWPGLVGTEAAKRRTSSWRGSGSKGARRTSPRGARVHVRHLRAQNIGAPFTTLMGMIPDTQVEAVERCSAFDGTWGMKREYYELSRKYGKKLSRALEDVGAVRLVSDCPLAGLNVTEDLGVTPAHPVEVLRDAYGLEPALPAAENVWPGGAEARCGRRSCAGGWCRVHYATRIVHTSRRREGVLVKVLPEEDRAERRARG